MTSRFLNLTAGPMVMAFQRQGYWGRNRFEEEGNVKFKTYLDSDPSGNLSRKGSWILSSTGQVI